MQLEPQKTALSFVLVTPARNEEAFIESTIRSVVAQTIRPTKWIIVSDGSTDGTDEIVKRYTHDHPWIEFLRMPEHRDRQFAAKCQLLRCRIEQERRHLSRRDPNDFQVANPLVVSVVFGARTLLDQRMTISIKSALAFSFSSGILNEIRIDFQCGRETCSAYGGSGSWIFFRVSILQFRVMHLFPGLNCAVPGDAFRG